VATGEYQSELVVAHGTIVSRVSDFLAARIGRDDLLVELPASGQASMIIDCTITGSRNDPSRRVWGSAIAWPPIARNNERVLDGVLSQRDVTEEPDQRRNGLSVHFAEHTLDLCRASMTSNSASHPSVTA
jgi:hypothetical protein